jgi:hypothetical protein
MTRFSNLVLIAPEAAFIDGEASEGLAVLEHVPADRRHQGVGLGLRVVLD